MRLRPPSSFLSVSACPTVEVGVSCYHNRHRISCLLDCQAHNSGISAGLLSLRVAQAFCHHIRHRTSGLQDSRPRNSGISLPFPRAPIPFLDDGSLLCAVQAPFFLFGESFSRFESLWRLLLGNFNCEIATHSLFVMLLVAYALFSYGIGFEPETLDGIPYSYRIGEIGDEILVDDSSGSGGPRETHRKTPPALRSQHVIVLHFEKA